MNYRKVFRAAAWVLLAAAFIIHNSELLHATTVTGTVYDSAGNAVSGAAITFRLINIGRGNVARNSGTSIVAPALVTAMSASDGTFSVTLVGNDQITPAGTLYEVEMRGPGFTYGPFDYSITGASADLNSLTPEATYPNTPSQVAASQIVPPSGCIGGEVLEWTGTAWQCAAAGSGSGAQHQVNGTNVAANSTVNFENSAPTSGLTLSFSNPSAGNVQLALSGSLDNAGLTHSSVIFNGQSASLGASANIPFSVNGANDSTLTGLNAITSTTNAVGLTVTPSNPSGNDWKFEITGASYTGNAATATALAAVPSQCAGGQFATGIAASGNANCSTPAGGGSPGGASGSVQYNNAGVFGGIDKNAFSATSNIIRVSPNCVTGQTNCFQVKDDGFMATDCTVNNGSPTVTCASSHFTSAMADGLHHIAVFRSCSTDAGLSTYATALGASGATISAFTSGTSITASSNATLTVTGTACVFVASLDDTALSNAETAAQASPVCPTIALPAGIMGIAEPHFTVLPNSCAITGVKTGISAYGPLYTIKGQGMNNTTLWLTPDFDAAACTNGAASTGCFVNYFGDWKDWGITGGGLPAFTSNHQIVTSFGSSTSYFHNWSCVNVGPNSLTNVYGVGAYANQTYFSGSLLDGCGGYAVFVSFQTESINSSFQDSGKGEILVGNARSFTSFGGNKYFGAAGMGGAVPLIAGGIVKTGPNDVFFANGATLNLRCWVSNESGDSFTMNDSTCDAQQGIVIQNTAATINLRGDSLSGASGSIITTAGNPATINDWGGNSVATAPSLVAGTIVAPSLSILGKQVGGNITPSTGWGTTGAAGNGVSAVSGTSLREQFTITGAGTPSASPTVAVNFPAAFWVAPICTVRQTGGTGALNTMSVGTPSTTAVTLTWNGTPVAASTYVIELECSN